MEPPAGTGWFSGAASPGPSRSIAGIEAGDVIGEEAERALAASVGRTGRGECGASGGSCGAAAFARLATPPAPARAAAAAALDAALDATPCDSFDRGGPIGRGR